MAALLATPMVGVGAWALVDELNKKAVEPFSIAFALIALLCAIYMVGLSATATFIASPDRLEFRCFGLKRWSIPVRQIGIGESNNPRSMYIVDARTGRIKGDINSRFYNKIDLETFSVFVDATREAAGITFIDPPDDDGDDFALKDLALTFVRPLGVMCAMFAVLLAITAFRQHLSLNEVVLRAAEVFGLLVALFAFLVLFVLAFSRFMAHRAAKKAGR